MDVTNKLEHFFLLKLNLATGKKAKSLLDFPIAFEYYTFAMSLLDNVTWETDYDITLELHIEAMEVAYTCRDIERNARDKRIEEAIGTYNELSQSIELFIYELETIKNELKAYLQ